MAFFWILALFLVITNLTKSNKMVNFSSHNTPRSHFEYEWDDNTIVESFSQHLSDDDNLVDNNNLSNSDGVLDKVLDDIIASALQSYHITQCVSGLAPSNTSYIKREYEALKAIYESTDGSHWHISVGDKNMYPGKTWNIDTNGTDYNDPCAEKWAGVICRHDALTGNCIVSMLILYNFNLNGYLPTEIGYLTSLELILIEKNNLGAGLIPTEIGNLCRLSFLSLPWNNIRGEIPTQLGRLTALRLLALPYNDLTNTLPTEIGQLTNLHILVVKKNLFNGSIPQELQNLKQLIVFSFGGCAFEGVFPSAIIAMTELRWLEFPANYISGQIPPELTNIKNLYVIDFDSNLLSGPLPDQIGAKLQKLLWLSASYNALNGSIPSSMGRNGILHHLVYISLNNNSLSGHIPTSLGRLSKLYFLCLGNNKLTGPIPSELGDSNPRVLVLRNNSLNGSIPYDLFISLNSSKLRKSIATMIDLSANKLSGPIPSSVYYLNSLRWLILYSNKLTGRLSSQVMNIRKLEALALFDNHLTGYIPAELSYISSLTSLSISKNSFSGLIPESIYNLTHLNLLDISYNNLRGRISSSIAKLINLTSLSVSSNSLSGQLPTTLGLLRSLTALFVGGNKLSGQLPPELQKLRRLQLADFSDNAFSGSLHNIINSTAASITLLGFSNNLFTGTLPIELLNLQNLTIFNAAVNCFDISLSIPISVCKSTSLEYLNLDGMSDNQDCQLSLDTRLLESSRSFAGLECLLEMPTLQTLHLSGNQMYGLLPTSLNLSASLQHLDLSHNLFRGNIPDYVFNHPWKTLNLGFNKFNGEISSNIYVMTKANITYQNNRLSGDVSTSYCNSSLMELRILDGNLFQCGCLQSDYSVKHYACGSGTTNQSFYIFTVFLVITVLYVACSSICWRRTRVQYTRVNYLLVTNEEIYASKCLLIVITVGLIVACGLHTYDYSTLCHLYAWYASFGYLTGPVPAIALVLYVATTSIVIYNAYNSKRCSSVEDDENKLIQTSNGPKLFLSPLETIVFSEDTPESSKRYEWICITTYFILNAVLSLTLNIIYVIYVKSLSGIVLVLVQQCFAIFKAAYQWVPVLIKNRIIEKLKMTNSTRRVWSKIADVDNRLRLNMFSIMIAPCIATSIADSNCFNDLACTIIPLNCPQPVTSSYQYTYSETQHFYNFEEGFLSAIGVTKHPDTSGILNLSVDTSFKPRFTYSYQCMSSLITTYVSVFLYLVMLGGIVLPLFRLLVQWIQVAINNALVAGVEHSNTYWYGQLRKIGDMMPNVLFKINISTTGSLELFVRDTVRRSFNVDNILSQMRMMRILGITFGLAYPPLGIAIFLCILCHIYLTNIQIEYYVDNVDQSIQEIVVDELTTSLKVLTKCNRTESFLMFGKVNSNSLSLVVVSCMFMWLLVFDTIGDSVGFGRAIWVSIVAILPLPILVSWLNAYVVPQVKTSCRKPSVGKISSRKDLALNVAANPLQVKLYDVKDDL